MQTRRFRTVVRGLGLAGAALGALPLGATLWSRQPHDSTPFANLAHAAPPAPPAPVAPLELGPGCVRETLGGPTSCKPERTWTEYAANACRKRQKVVGAFRADEQCRPGHFRQVEFTCCPQPESTIPLHAGAGLVAAWNSVGRAADPSAVEVNRAWGYEIPRDATQCPTGPDGRAHAFYYLKSAEDFTNTPGAAVFDPNRRLAGFPSFSAALARHHRDASELVLRFSTLPLVTPAFPGVPEVRQYGNGRVGIYWLQLGNDRMIRGSLREAPLALRIDYQNPQDCADDRISGVTQPAPAEDDSRSPAMREIAQAFLADLNGRRLQLVFDSFQPAIVDRRMLTIQERGRYGAYFTIGSGAIRAVP